jgi:ubiquitin-protein ligase
MIVDRGYNNCAAQKDLCIEGPKSRNSKCLPTHTIINIINEAQNLLTTENDDQPTNADYYIDIINF